MSLANRPPLGVLRQFSRAVLADRLVGDELLRLAMARVDVDPGASSAQAADLVASFLQSWRLTSRDHVAAALFSDRSLRQALPPPPEDERLAVLLVDVLGFSSAEANRIVGRGRISHSPLSSSVAAASR